jgi:ABC-type transporter MlaC component
MTVGTPGLTEAKELAKKLYDDEFGAHYLLGYMWATLTDEQKQDVLESLQRYLDGRKTNDNSRQDA